MGSEYFATGLLSFKYDSPTPDGKIVYRIMDLKQHKDFISIYLYIIIIILVI